MRKINGLLLRAFGTKCQCVPMYPVRVTWKLQMLCFQCHALPLYVENGCAVDSANNHNHRAGSCLLQCLREIRPPCPQVTYSSEWATWHALLAQYSCWSSGNMNKADSKPFKEEAKMDAFLKKFLCTSPLNNNFVNFGQGLQAIIYFGGISLLVTDVDLSGSFVFLDQQHRCWIFEWMELKYLNVTNFRLPH